MSLLESIHPTLWPDDSARARRSDPLTSHAAADSNTNRRAVMEAVMHLFSTIGPMTDEELTTAYELSAHVLPEAHADSPRKRRSDLVKAGVLRETGERRLISTGRNARVWEVAS